MHVHVQQHALNLDAFAASNSTNLLRNKSLKVFMTINGVQLVLNGVNPRKEVRCTCCYGDIKGGLVGARSHNSKKRVSGAGASRTH